MANSPILFMSPGCGACIKQEKILRDYFMSIGKHAVINLINLDRFPGKFKDIQFTPTWAFPQGGDKYKLYPNIIEDPKMIKAVSSFGRKRSNRRSRFGAELLPNINNLAVYGKNFPNGKGFDIPQSYYGTVENIWGKGDDTLNAGVGGTRSLGPDNIVKMYSNGYFNEIRMAQPADQLGAAINLNRSCNKSTSLSSPGIIFDSPNPQIVDNTTGFGRRKRRSRFGNLYSQMGPASEIGNQYLINKDTGNQLYSGARQNETPRPYSINNKSIYIGQAPIYNPIKSASFGKKKKSKKVKEHICYIGEGTILTVSKKSGKIKVKKVKKVKKN